jgi:hypothetical protein
MAGPPRAIRRVMVLIAAQRIIASEVAGWRPGRMVATWFDGPADAFVAACRQACDVTCTGRFIDLLELRDGRWGIVLRRPVYEKDRIDPVVPGQVPVLDTALSGRFPAGCRHLLYAQTQAGMQVMKTEPGLRGPEIEALYREVEDWLSGQSDAR